MENEPLRQHLVRYRLTRDPMELAALFEATAPRLWPLAMHLARDPADADDLLQSTYVALIESVERFDPERSVMAWMTGILTNQARDLGRRGARRPDPERLLERVEAEPSPERATQTAEERTLLAEAVEGLPALYRQVVELVVEKGIGPAEIAARLDRTPGAVRVQLHRAVGMLRRTLPGSMALPAVLLTTQSVGLEQVRRAVHEAALKHGGPLNGATGATAGAGGGASLPGGLKLTGLAVGLCAAGLMTWRNVRADQAEPLRVMMPPPLEAVEPAREPVPTPRAVKSVRPGKAERPVPEPRHEARSSVAEATERADELATMATNTQEPRRIELWLSQGKGLSLATGEVVAADQADVRFELDDHERIHAGAGVRLARLAPEALGTLVCPYPPCSADAYMRAVTAFRPERLEWRSEWRFDPLVPGQRVFAFEGLGGYGVIASVQRRRKRGRTETLVHGVFHPSRPEFGTSREAFAGGFALDPSALETDPFREELWSDLADRRYELRRRVKRLSRSDSVDPERVFGVLAREHAEEFTLGPWSRRISSFGFEDEARDPLAPPPVSGSDFALVEHGVLDVRPDPDDRSLAWVVKGRIERLTRPRPGKGAVRLPKLRKGTLIVIHAFNDRASRWDALRVLEFDRGKWLIFEWLPIDDSDWIDAAERSAAMNSPPLEKPRVQVQLSSDAEGRRVRAYLDGTVSGRTSLEKKRWARASRPSTNPSGRAYVTGGSLEPRRNFEIHEVTWIATVATHSEHGPKPRLAVELAGIRVTEEPILGLGSEGRWTGAVRLAGLDMTRSFVEIQGRVECEVSIQGRWIETSR